MKKAHVFLAILSGLGFSQQLHAQNNTSPYSSIGFGDIEKSTFDRTTGMGGAGVALSSNRFLYHANPASYSFIDDRFFTFESSVRFKNVNYSGTAITSSSNNQSSDLQFKKIAASIKLKPKWGFSIGLLPFSSSNYSFYGKKTIVNSPITQDAYYEGSGSLNQAYIANSYKLAKNLSIGLQMSYIFGQFDKTETLYNGAADSTLVTKDNISIGNPYFKLGIQYKAKLGKNWAIATGATGNLQTQLHTNYGKTVTYGGYNVYSNDLIKTEYFNLPASATAGIAAILKEKVTFALDYSFQNWGNVQFTNQTGYKIVNSNKLSGGIEFAKKLEFADGYTNKKILFERYFYQIGGFYQNSYLQISGEQLADYGVTLGFGINSIRNPLGLMASVELGRRGTTAKGLLQEDYSQVNLTLCYRDIWFTSKRRYN